ncbi:hypothetical protein VSO92_07965 [Myroides pelagicus]|nr:hypothetical protein [Myroides pelagicus]MEC4114039.1 hypothetical protein [Myroides pelagicus]
MKWPIKRSKTPKKIYVHAFLIYTCSIAQALHQTNKLIEKVVANSEV